MANKDKAKKVAPKDLNQNAINDKSELTEEDLDSVSGGTKASPTPKSDEAPKETISFEYTKLEFR